MPIVSNALHASLHASMYGTMYGTKGSWIAWGSPSDACLAYMKSMVTCQFTDAENRTATQNRLVVGNATFSALVQSGQPLDCMQGLPCSMTVRSQLDADLCRRLCTQWTLIRPGSHFPLKSLRASECQETCCGQEAHHTWLHLRPDVVWNNEWVRVVVAECSPSAIRLWLPWRGTS